MPLRPPKKKERGKPSWVPSLKRWRVRFKQKAYYFVYPNTKEGRLLADEDWKSVKNKLLDEAAFEKPHRKDYERTIASHKKIIRWCELNPTFEYSATMIQQRSEDIARLEKQFKTNNPPAIQRSDDPLWGVSAEGKWVWEERFRQLEDGPVEGQTLAHHIDLFIKPYYTLAQLGKRAYGRVQNLHETLNEFAAAIGEQKLIHLLSGKDLEQFQHHLLKRMAEKSISANTAADRLSNVKQFFRWAYEAEYLDNLPRNMRSVTIERETNEIKTYSIEEVKWILSVVPLRLKCHLLLMLNCGMTAKDISDLKISEVDLKKGTITRKRSKTQKHDKVPKVTYFLWQETLDLLCQFKSSDKERFFLSENGTPLVSETPGEKRKRTDSIGRQFFRHFKSMAAPEEGQKKKKKLSVEVVGRGLKGFRATGPTILENHESYGRYARYLLGHAPRGVMEKHYVKPSDEQFRKALTWLGKQFDIM